MDLARKVVRALEVPHTQEESGPGRLQFVSSDDLLPVPLEQRTWTAFSYVALWMITSGLIVLGMSWWQAWLSILIGYSVITPFIILMARPGAVFHITFPVVNRASFGIFGSLCVWYGVQSSIGGTCVLVMLRAIWPSVNNIPNSMPASSGTNTRDFMCFLLFWLISLPFIWPPVHKIRHFFTFKTILTSIACFIFMIWCIVKAKGVGPIISQPGTLHGSDLAWNMISGAGLCISSLITLITFWVAGKVSVCTDLFPALVNPYSFGVICLLGVIVSSSSQTIYGEVIWSPVDLLGKFLDDDPSPATRFGVWFIAASLIVAQGRKSTYELLAYLILSWFPLSRTNISANSNIRRGGYLCAIAGLVMCPWNLVSSSNRFTSYLSAYSIFLSAIAGVMATEYYFVRKGRYNVADLYATRRGSWYWYKYGFNPRAYAAYLAGIMINVVGFAGDTGTPVPIAATHIFQLSFFTGFGVSGIAYYILNAIFPPPGAADKFEEIDVSGYEERMSGLDEDTNSNDNNIEKEPSSA
ncbi:hypothetical protein M405DRAFT_837575 [Rhizopogon salebrosus TDB-379]|nr:hypothetical protein M405DRAFT_837575 [Rhizopogon salebrosus TDB-379]